MGRENGEDYGSEFLVMLNTWEAAVKFWVPHGTQKKTLDIARFSRVESRALRAAAPRSYCRRTAHVRTSGGAYGSEALGAPLLTVGPRTTTNGEAVQLEP
jgi:hypothetical protein